MISPEATRAALTLLCESRGASASTQAQEELQVKAAAAVLENPNIITLEGLAAQLKFAHGLFVKPDKEILRRLVSKRLSHAYTGMLQRHMAVKHTDAALYKLVCDAGGILPVAAAWRALRKKSPYATTIQAQRGIVQLIAALGNEAQTLVAPSAPGAAARLCTQATLEAARQAPAPSTFGWSHLNQAARLPPAKAPAANAAQAAAFDWTRLGSPIEAPSAAFDWSRLGEPVASSRKTAQRQGKVQRRARVRQPPDDRTVAHDSRERLQRQVPDLIRPKGGVYLVAAEPRVTVTLESGTAATLVVINLTLRNTKDSPRSLRAWDVVGGPTALVKSDSAGCYDTQKAVEVPARGTVTLTLKYRATTAEEHNLLVITTMIGFQIAAIIQLRIVSAEAEQIQQNAAPRRTHRRPLRSFGKKVASRGAPLLGEMCCERRAYKFRTVYEYIARAASFFGVELLLREMSSVIHSATIHLNKNTEGGNEERENERA